MERLSLAEGDGCSSQLRAVEGQVMETRLITFAGNTLAIEYSHARLARIVAFLYQYTPADNDIPPRLTYRLLSEDGTERLALYRGDTLLYTGESEAVLAELLLSDTCHHLAAHSRGGLLFHAAGLAWGDQGLLLPAGIGGGKSTLAAWLAIKGLDYLTDELVFVPEGMETMQTLTRPLNLKNPARAVLQDRFDFKTSAPHILSGPHSFLVPPTLLKPANRLSQPPLSLILFPHYLPGGDFSLRPLSKAQAGLELMQCLVNARNLPEHGFPEVTRLARRVPAYKMSYAHFDQLGECIESVLQSALPQAPERV
jgi:hypothetical protein